MFAAPTAPAPTPPHDPRALIEGQLAMLTRLAEAGLAVALAVEAQATGVQATGLQATGTAPAPEAGEDAAPGDAPEARPADLALAFARVSRAVRMTVALQSKLAHDLRVVDRNDAEARRQRRRTVMRIVGRVVRAGEGDGEGPPESDEFESDGFEGDEFEFNDGEAERLLDEAAERLDHEDLYGDVAARPLSEIVAQVCRDLGLSPDWPRLAQEAWARAEIDTGAPGAPLAALGAAPLAAPPSAGRSPEEPRRPRWRPPARDASP